MKVSHTMRVGVGCSQTEESRIFVNSLLYMGVRSVTQRYTARLSGLTVVRLGRRVTLVCLQAAQGHFGSFGLCSTSRARSAGCVSA